MANVRQARKRIVHGKNASAAALGVPETYHDTYAHFVSEDKPFDLRREMALIRVLYQRMEDHLHTQSGNTIEMIANSIEEKLARIYGEKTKDKEKLAGIIRTCSQVATQVVKDELGLSAIKLDDLMDLSDHIEKISRVAERMKKIQEGVKLQVNIDTNLLVKFIQEVVYPFVPERSVRSAMIEQAMRLSLPNRVEREANTQPRTAVTPENLNPLGELEAVSARVIEQTEVTLEDILNAGD